MQTLAELQQKFNAIDDISFSELNTDYPIVKVHNTYATAMIALQGAHLINYKPLQSDSILFTSKDAIFKKGKSIRGGIPVCWPWFGAHPTDGSLPSHGYARTTFWLLDNVTAHKAGTSLIF